MPAATRDDGIHELAADLSGSPYYSFDMAPTTPAQRRWGMKDIAVLWISMSACIPTYMLASGLINSGMNWAQAIGTIFLGNVIVLIPMVLNAHAGTKYGIPFPVYCRASFGLRGANVPALLRALVACGWFGIQTWIGGEAIYVLLGVFFPAWKDAAPVFSTVNAPQLACFFAFWLVNMLVIYKGIESIRILLNIKAPLLIALGLALLAWAYNRAGGFGEMLSKPSQFAPGGPKEGEFWHFFILALTGNVSFWATLALNIPDFSRYARSQRDQVVGQALGLPTTMGLYSFIGVAVTSAALVIYKDLPVDQKDKLWNPVFLLSLFENKAVLVVAMIALCIATLATNIAANVVSPANDFAHLWPRVISFRIGGLITGLIGILIQPWRLVANERAFISTSGSSAIRCCWAPSAACSLPTTSCCAAPSSIRPACTARRGPTGTPAASTPPRSSPWPSASPFASQASWRRLAWWRWPATRRRQQTCARARHFRPTLQLRLVHQFRRRVCCLSCADGHSQC